MNYIGSYHTGLRLGDCDACDAPCTSMGRMSVACADTASSARGMAMAYGIMRNRSALARALNLSHDTSQSQLVLAAYGRWGEDYALHIQGPCMSCVMDRELDKLLLTRDRMGECSLFFASRGEGLVFSDHPDSILRTGFIPAVLDRGAACELFGLGPARTPGKTFLAGMESLKPGCQLICEGGDLRIRSYFALSCCEHDEDEHTTVAHTRALLEQAMDGYVHLHPSTMLSGGLDSTALTALLCGRIGRVDSFSVDYADNDRDFVANAYRPELDAPYIRLATKHFGTRHRRFVLNQQALAGGLDAALDMRGFPGMGDIDSSLMLFAGQIALHSHAVISGECGDEVFGGYPWFRADAPLREEVFPWSGSMALRSAVLRPEIREKLQIDAYVRDALRQSVDSYDLDGIPDGDERRLFCMQRLCFDYFMPNLQERAAKMCDGMGVAVLTPLCDERLVQYVWNVPWRMKRMGGMEKGLFRAAVADLLPEKLLMRKKSPYPKTCSPIYANLLRDRMSALLAEEDAPLWQLCDRDFVSRFNASDLDPSATPWYGQLMAGPQLLAYLLQINSWMRVRDVAVEL